MLGSEGYLVLILTLPQKGLVGIRVAHLAVVIPEENQQVHQVIAKQPEVSDMGIAVTLLAVKSLGGTEVNDCVMPVGRKLTDQVIRLIKL